MADSDSTSSGSDSSSDSGSGSSDSAYVASPRQAGSLAALRAQQIQPLIHDPRWTESNTGGFESRFAASRYSFSSSPNNLPRALKRTDSGSMSTAVAPPSRSTTWGSTSSAYPPSLGSGSTAASGSSARTTDADSILKQSLLEDVNGVLERRQPGLPCPYGILDCSFTSPDLPIWETHSLSHFKGSPPKICSCPFEGCVWSVEAETAQQAWYSRSAHIRTHSSTEWIVRPILPGHAHVGHLWRTGVIGTAELKELRQNGRLGMSSAAVLRSSRDDRRGRPGVGSNIFPTPTVIIADPRVGPLMERGSRFQDPSQVVPPVSSYCVMDWRWWYTPLLNIDARGNQDWAKDHGSCFRGAIVCLTRGEMVATGLCSQQNLLLVVFTSLSRSYGKPTTYNPHIVAFMRTDQHIGHHGDHLT